MKMKMITMIVLLTSSLGASAQQVHEKYECIKEDGSEMTIELKDQGDENTLSFQYDNVYGRLDLSDPTTIYNEEEIYEERESKEGPFKNHWFGFLEYAEYEHFFKLDKVTMEGEYMSSQYIYPKSLALRILSKSEPYVRQAKFKCERVK